MKHDDELKFNKNNMKYIKRERVLSHDGEHLPAFRYFFEINKKIAEHK